MPLTIYKKGHLFLLRKRKRWMDKALCGAGFQLRLFVLALDTVGDLLHLC